jgi:hypothetical protein
MKGALPMVGKAPTLICLRAPAAGDAAGEGAGDGFPAAAAGLAAGEGCAGGLVGALAAVAGAGGAVGATSVGATGVGAHAAAIRPHTTATLESAANGARDTCCIDQPFCRASGL